MKKILLFGIFAVLVLSAILNVPGVNAANTNTSNVYIPAIPASLVAVTSPSAAETWALSDQKIIRWNYPKELAGRSVTVAINMISAVSSASWKIYQSTLGISTNIPSGGAIPWSLLSSDNSSVNIASGRYYINAIITDISNGKSYSGRSGIFNVVYSGITTSTPTPSSIVSANLSASAPASSDIYNDKVTGSRDVDLLKFEVMSGGADVNFIKVGVNMASNSASLILPTVLKLYDGDTLISTASDTTTRDIATFENFKYPLPSYQIKEFAIKGDYLPIESKNNINLINNNLAVLQILATSANALFEKSDGSTDNIAISAPIQGNAMRLLRAGVHITLLRAKNIVNSTTTRSQATGSFIFSVQPFGGAMTKPISASSASDGANQITVLAYDAKGNIYASSATRMVITNPSQNIPDGGSATITVIEVVTNDGSTGPGLVKFKIADWGWEIGGVPGHSFSDTWVTPSANLSGISIVPGQNRTLTQFFANQFASIRNTISGILMNLQELFSF